jgi:hypothetical protein
MDKKKTILLTFDHELFLGSRSGDVNSCMIEPTRLLQEIFNEFRIEKAVFFLDTTYVSNLKRNLEKEDCRLDFEKVESNIKFLLDKGHYVFPHIHPHWLDADYQEGNWVLNNLEKYTFNACSHDERAKIWCDSIQVLKDFGVDKYHEIDSFRAGGWSIQPFEDYKPYFDQYGIKNDFTVLPQSYSYTNAQKYDFTSAPRKAIYKFDKEVTEPSDTGIYFEFPISTRPSPQEDGLKEKVLKKWLWKTNNKSIGKGQGVLPKKVEYEPREAPKDVEMISIELMHMLNFKDYVKHLDEHDVVQFISHPKMLSRHNLKMFRKFMKYASQNYNLDFDFKSLK